MTAAIIERPRSRAARWAARCANFSAILFLVSALAHRYELLETPAFLVVLAIILALAALALLLAASGFASLWTVGARGGRASAGAALVAGLVAAPFGVSAVQYLALPELNDISTDLQSPPRFFALANLRSDRMNAVAAITAEDAALQMEAYPGVTGHRYDLDAARTGEAVEAVVTSRGWTVVSHGIAPRRNAGTTVEAVAKSLLLGFKSDVAIRLRGEGGATAVDMRSAARFGRHDFGSDARLIEAFFRDLDPEIASRMSLAPTEPEN